MVLCNTCGSIRTISSYDASSVVSETSVPYNSNRKTHTHRASLSIGECWKILYVFLSWWTRTAENTTSPTAATTSAQPISVVDWDCTA